MIDNEIAACVEEGERIIDDAVNAEREACAAIVDLAAAGMEKAWLKAGPNNHVRKIATAIRARGTT